MSCNCKKKPKPVVDHLVGLELIRKGIIEEEVLSKSELRTLYDYYNMVYDGTTPYTCNLCWDDYIKDKLKELWKNKIEESLESPQN